MMTLFDSVVLVLVLFFCAYTIINRICRCLENRAYAKAIGAMDINTLIEGEQKLDATK